MVYTFQATRFFQSSVYAKRFILFSWSLHKTYLNGQAIYNIARTSSCLSLFISILLYFPQIHHPLTADGSRSTRGQRVHLQLWDTAGQER